MRPEPSASLPQTTRSQITFLFAKQTKSPKDYCDQPFLLQSKPCDKVKAIPHPRQFVGISMRDQLYLKEKASQNCCGDIKILLSQWQYGKLARHSKINSPRSQWHNM